MDARQSFRVAVIVTMAFQMLISFGAVGLLERMIPATREIIRENVVTLEFIETMLASLPLSGRSDDAAKARFETAVKGAKGNISEPEERRLLESVELLAPQMFSGELLAVEGVRGSLVALGRVNREAIDRKARNAERLGLGGSWALVLLSLVALLVAYLVYISLVRRIVLPLAEICTTLKEWRAGNFLRRCDCANASSEIKSAMNAMNQLLDQKIAR